MTHEEMIAVISAHRDGKKIQFRSKERPTDRWNSYAPESDPTWNFDSFDYRVENPYREIFAVRLQGGELISPYFEEADAIVESKRTPGRKVIRYVIDEDYKT